MILIQSLHGQPIEYFDDYNELFDCLITIENLKCLATRSTLKHRNWNFTVHVPLRVAALYLFSQDPSQALEEAFTGNLALIEICSGDYKRPQHIVLTPNVDLGYLKKKWCVDYCTFHHLVVRDG